MTDTAGRESVFERFMGKSASDGITPNETDLAEQQLVEDKVALEAAERVAKDSTQEPLKAGEIERICDGCGTVYRGARDGTRIQMFMDHIRRHPTHAGVVSANQVML